MADPVDRRVRKTRRQIQDALFALMKEMPYGRIHIGHISDRADISRSTFYLHYQTKDDLLMSVVDEIIDEYFRAIDTVTPGAPASPAFLLFSKWKQNLEKMRLVLDAGMEYRVFQRLRAFNNRRLPQGDTSNALLNDYARTMLDGASFALLLRWTRDGARVPVEQMDKLFNALNIAQLFSALERDLPDFGQVPANQK
jgi:AcrR family transcriptional regulator